MAEYRLMIVCNDDTENRELDLSFTGRGYRVVTAGDCEEATEILSRGKQPPDLVLIACGSPEPDLYQFLDRLKSYEETAVFIYSSDDSAESQLSYYKKGIDEFLKKPAGIPVLQAHVSAVAKRTHIKRDQVEKAGEMVLHRDSRKVYLGGRPLTVTTKEYDLLEYFIRHQGMTLSRDKILDTIWGFDYIGSYRSVDTLVKKLRAKMTKKYPYIKTIYGIGYSFEAGIQEE